MITRPSPPERVSAGDGFAARGEVRTQFAHVIDVAPTVLEAAGLPEPTFVNGIQQTPIQGTSMRYSFDDAAAADELIAATDLADLLVKRGTPFREAHGVIAGLVREAVESGRSLAEVAVPALGEDAAAVLERSSWLESKVSEGGTSLARVREQLERARALL